MRAQRSAILSFVKVFGHLIFLAAGIVMFVFEIQWFHTWWGDGGVIAAVFLPPLALAFPFLYLVKEGFSLLYFGVWAIGMAGLFVAAKDD